VSDLNRNHNAITVFPLRTHQKKPEILVFSGKNTGYVP
jgi:hypothetical protein